LPPEAERDITWQPPQQLSGVRNYGGRCDQFGDRCRMWECPDFFDVVPGEIQAFKYSDQSRSRTPFGADYYVLGDAVLTNYTLALAQDGHDAYSGRLGGGDAPPYVPRLLDYGAVYASKSFRLLPTDDTDGLPGRLLWLGWVYEVGQTGLTMPLWPKR
jgi:sucrose-6-phosphate hydrolase SacC (GH32 family)